MVQLAEGVHRSSMAEFTRRFEARARQAHGGVSCSEISGVDWTAGPAARLESGYPPAQCQALADAAAADLKELLDAGPSRDQRQPRSSDLP